MGSALSTSLGLDACFKKATLAQEAVASEHQQEEMQQEEERKDEEEEEKETEGGAAEEQWPPGPEGQSCSPATDSACASMPCAILFDGSGVAFLAGAGPPMTSLWAKPGRDSSQAYNSAATNRSWNGWSASW